jgi:hypothetical protein
MGAAGGVAARQRKRLRVAGRYRKHDRLCYSVSTGCRSFSPLQPICHVFSFIFWVKGKKDWKLPTISLLVLIRSTLFFLPNNTLFYFFLFSRIQVRYRL